MGKSLLFIIQGFVLFVCLYENEVLLGGFRCYFREIIYTVEEVELDFVVCRYIVLNRPYAFLQWVQQARIPEKYVLMGEPDHLWLKPMPNLMIGQR